MKLTAFFRHRLRWINLPGALLVALLQRTPVIPVAQLAEEFVLSSPISAILKSSAVLTSLGALHSLAGATTVTASSPTPLKATAGTPITTVVFGSAGTDAQPGSWDVTGTLPPGVAFGGKTTLPISKLNVTNPALSGTPTTAGTYQLTIVAWEGADDTIQATPSFSYTITVSAGTTATAPVITAQPLSVTVNGGGTVAFTVAATSTATLSYQWKTAGANLAGATSDTLILTGVAAANAGTYTVVVSNSGGSVTSNPATLAVTSGQVSRISNLSVRTNLGSGQTLTVGFVTSGPKNMLVRADGPALGTVFGLTGFYPDPEFVLQNQSTGATLASNDNWSSTLAPVFSSLGAFPFVTGSTDAALLASLNGPILAQVSGSGSGVMLVEVYDDDAASAPNHLTNLSARNQVGTGANILISGFVVDGAAARTLLIRGIGPALHDVFGVSGSLPDPYLEIHETINGQDTVVASNDNWNGSLATIFNQVGAYQFTPGSKDAALLVTLPPGVYTAQVSGLNGGTGDGVVEVYVVP